MKISAVVVALLAGANLIKLGFANSAPNNNQFTVIPYNYQAVTSQSRAEIDSFLPFFNSVTDPNKKLALIAEHFSDRPYAELGAEGEGDWCNLTQRGCVHVQQDPVYRTDILNCFTLVQNMLALFHAGNIKDYEKNILNIAYGAAGEPAATSIHYYNRNNFVSADFNPINEKRGIISDVTGQGVFAKYVKTTSAIIDRQTWFAFQTKPDVIAQNVRVLKAVDGPAMYKRFSQYPDVAGHTFLPQKVSISYIPKEVLVKPVAEKDGKVAYVPDEKLINQIPTPAIVEIIRNAKLWDINGVNIKDIIGTELNVSHVGLLYRQQFKYKQTIYQSIACSKDNTGTKNCVVTPVTCVNKNGCSKTMFLDATSAYPSGYYYYQSPTESNHYICAATPAPAHVPYTTCNRVMALPLGDYLASYQYGSYIFMTSPSIVGIHVEKIN